MNFKKRLLTFILLLLSLFPSIVFAYSDKIILGGDNVGIKVNTKYVMIVGFYKVDGHFIGEDAGLKIGDYITKINDKKVSSIDEMINIINNVEKKEDINISYIRNNKELSSKLPLVKDQNGVYKTGLYVKDQINGIGTLTYIDPETKIFGALGHEIADKNTLRKVEILNGTIFKSDVTGIKPSSNGEPGSKEAKLYPDISYGSIISNTDKGIFGNISDSFKSDNIIEVADSNSVVLGKAYLRTVINDNTIKNYDIEIINIDSNNPTKNILFEITDKELLAKTGGVVAGMSGSPIIQNNKIIGAVTHVVVNEPSKGYGIFITTMLEEGEKE